MNPARKFLAFIEKIERGFTTSFSGVGKKKRKGPHREKTSGRPLCFFNWVLCAKGSSGTRATRPATADSKAYRRWCIKGTLVGAAISIGFRGGDSGPWAWVAMIGRSLRAAHPLSVSFGYEQVTAIARYFQGCVRPSWTFDPAHQNSRRSRFYFFRTDRSLPLIPSRGLLLGGVSSLESHPIPWTNREQWGFPRSPIAPLLIVCRFPVG